MIHKDISWTFLLIRHAKSMQNIDEASVGGRCINVPLAPEGVRQGLALEKRLREENRAFTHVYTSAAVRTYDTARLALPACPSEKIVRVAALDELDQGDWQGKLRSEAYTAETLLYLIQKGNDFLPKNGESQRLVERRAATWLEDTFIYNSEFIAQQKNAEIGIFSSAITIKTILHYVMNFDQAFIYKMNIENTSISELHFSEKGWRVMRVNDHAHLVKTGADHWS